MLGPFGCFGGVLAKRREKAVKFFDFGIPLGFPEDLQEAPPDREQKIYGLLGARKALEASLEDSWSVLGAFLRASLGHIGTHVGLKRTPKTMLKTPQGPPKSTP